jgi:hypothetical protein
MGRRESEKDSKSTRETMRAARTQIRSPTVRDFRHGAIPSGEKKTQSIKTHLAHVI